jgi:hypothetical protein
MPEEGAESQKNVLALFFSVPAVRSGIWRRLPGHDFDKEYNDIPES